MLSGSLDCPVSMLSGSLDCPVSMLSGSLDCPVSMLSGSLDCPVSMLSGSLDCLFLIAVTNRTFFSGQVLQCIRHVFIDFFKCFFVFQIMYTQKC
jgi:hypothetical protein